MKDESKELAESLIDSILFSTKEVLTSDEVSRYLGITKSYLYKLTMKKQIPHYKPMGKLVYFKRTEIEEWSQQNRCSTSTEIGDKANKILMGIRTSTQSRNEDVDKQRFKNMEKTNKQYLFENKELRNKISDLEEENKRLKAANVYLQKENEGLGDENQKLKEMNDNLMSAWKKVQTALGDIVKNS